MTTDNPGPGNRGVEPDDLNEGVTLWDDKDSVFSMLRNARGEKDINEAKTIFEVHGTTGASTDTEPKQSLDTQGRYRILRRLGEGGMGTVYLCEDTKLERNVAVKKPTAANAALFSALVREAQALAQLSHPNIVNVLELNDDPEDSFIVMEYLPSGSLADRLDRTGPLKLSRAYFILRQVCEGLQYAHESGIIHRDVKPSNILFSGNETAKLGDFGLALKATNVRSPNATSSVGSPSYMAPEQRSGVGTIDQRADVYGLAATLYRMLVGAPPGRDVSTSLSERLQDFFARALAAVPSDRITTVGAFMEELGDLLNSSDDDLSTTTPPSYEDDISPVQITSIDEVVTFRDIISPIADVDFFINLHADGKRYAEDKIATVIKGVNYRKEITKYQELKSQTSRDLETLEKQGKKIKRHLAGLEIKAKFKNPGSPPNKPFFNSSNPAEAQAVFQQQLESHRIAQREYESIRNETEDARQDYNRATRLYDQKSRELEDLFRQQEAQVCIAFDLDILVFLGEMTRRVDQSINYDRNYFEGFVLVYFANKAHPLLREYITSADIKYKAKDIHDRLEDEFNSHIFTRKQSVRAGLDIAAKCCVEELMLRNHRNEIDILLEQIPTQACAEYFAETEALVGQQIDFEFPFDAMAAANPTGVDTLKENLKRLEEEFAGISTRMRDLVHEAQPVLDTLSSIRSSCEAMLAKMIEKEREEKQREQDLLFVMNVFDKKENSQVLLKYARWLTDVEQRLEEKYDIQIGDLISGEISRKGVVQEAVELVRDSGRWRLLECKEILDRHRSQLTASIQQLREKTEFAFSLSDVRSAQENNPDKKNKRLKRSVYRKLVAEGRQAHWNKEQIDRAISPFVPGSLVIPVVSTGLGLGLITTVLTYFFLNIDKFYYTDDEEQASPSLVATHIPQAPSKTGDDRNASQSLPKKAKLLERDTRQAIHTPQADRPQKPSETGRNDRNASQLLPEKANLPEPDEIQTPYERKQEGNKAIKRYAQETGQDLIASDEVSEKSLQLNYYQIREIQGWLRDAGHFRKKESNPIVGELDKWTRKAIKRYQRSFGTKKTGYTGYLNNALISALEVENQLDLNKDGRREVQDWLKGAGHNLGDSDGDFGQKTRGAIRAYQNSRGIKATGILNRETYSSLRARI